MILFRAELFEGLHEPTRLREALQTALELEHATIPPYLLAWNDPRVVGLLPFSYGREDASKGSFDSRTVTALQVEHRRIWAAMKG